jgi:hypothetical protein
VKDFFHLPITSRQGLITSTFAVRFICRNTYRPVEQDVMLNVTKCREKSIGDLPRRRKSDAHGSPGRLSARSYIQYAGSHLRGSESIASGFLRNDDALYVSFFKRVFWLYYCNKIQKSTRSSLTSHIDYIHEKY